MANINIKTKKMKAETFKSLFNEDIPAKVEKGDKYAFFKGGFFAARPQEDCRVISEGLYQKMLTEIEKLQPIITENTAQAIVDLATENAELRRGIGDIVIFLAEASKGRTHIAIKHDDFMLQIIFDALNRNVDTIKNHWVK